MDAVKCVKEFNRMCRTYTHCSDGCPLKGRCILLRNPNADSESIEALVAAVEKWSKRHPLKTNGMVILEKMEMMDVPGWRTMMNELEQKVEIEIDAEWWDAEYEEGAMSKPISDPVFDIGRDLQRAYDEGYKQGRYDEKVAAIDALKEHRALYCDNTPETFSKLSYAEKSRVDELDTAIATLVNLPSAQPEQKKGKWIDYTEDGYVECPFCHSATNCDGNKDELRFCFSCGADMRGDTE